jgi:hypothetical protein
MFRALKSDSIAARVKAFAKRLLQVRLPLQFVPSYHFFCLIFNFNRAGLRLSATRVCMRLSFPAQRGTRLFALRSPCLDHEAQSIAAVFDRPA